MLTRPRPIDDLWASYEQRVIPAGAGRIQRSEMKRSFYAGATSLFHCIATRLEPGQGATENDIQFMEDVQSNIMLHIAEVRAEASKGRMDA